MTRNELGDYRHGANWAIRKATMNGKKGIRASLTCLAVLTGLVVVAGLLWLLMDNLGDQEVAVGVMGVLLVAAASWVLCFIALVVLLALAVLKQSDVRQLDDELERFDADEENYEDRFK